MIYYYVVLNTTFASADTGWQSQTLNIKSWMEEESMSFKVIMDSCGEMTEEMKQDERFEAAALTLTVGGEDIIDDESFEQSSFLKRWLPHRNARNRPVLHRKGT